MRNKPAFWLKTLRSIIFSFVVINISRLVFSRPFLNKTAVKVGQSNITAGAGINGVEKFVYHPNFTLGTNYNFALIKLKKNLKFSKVVKKIQIASKSPDVREKLITTGWGLVGVGVSL